MRFIPLAFLLALLGSVAPSIAGELRHPDCNAQTGSVIQRLSGNAQVCFPKLGTWRLPLGRDRYLLVNQNLSTNIEGQITVIHGESLAPVALNSDKEIVESYLHSLSPDLTDWRETSRRWSDGELTVVLHHVSQQRIRMLSLTVRASNGDLAVIALDRFYLVENPGSLDPQGLLRMFLIKAP